MYASAGCSVMVHQSMNLENRIRAKATAAGFSECGFTRLRPLAREDFLRTWLAQGNAGDMHYLARWPERRLNPAIPFPQAKSAICLAYPYTPPVVPKLDWKQELRGRIAAYAAGLDYHDRIAARLRELTAFLGEMRPGLWARPYVDTGPLLEREWACHSGLGWFGKNTMLLRKRAGSWFFLAEVLVDLELEGAGLAQDHCGRCTRCMDACPTGALEDGYVLRSPVCISYLTIEHRGAISPALRPKLGNWIFGCDICQEVCPWNTKFAQPRHIEALLPSLPELMALDDNGFRRRYRKTALWRTRRRGLLRNVAIALGNSGNPQAIPPLRHALHDPEALIRAHAAWALGQLEQRATLRRALDTEDDPQVRAEIEAALGEAPASLPPGTGHLREVQRIDRGSILK